MESTFSSAADTPRDRDEAVVLDSMAAARAVVDELEAQHVRHVVLCPGSRSAPLAYALAEAEAEGRIRVQVRIDERDAGFLALGLAESTQSVVGIVTTSGTAVGELLPAVMEANHAAVPLLVLSADRPVELHGTGANQTTHQADLFGTHVRASLTVPAGEDPRTQVRAAVAAAAGNHAAAGPVQMDLCFRDPLTPLAELPTRHLQTAGIHPRATAPAPEAPKQPPLTPSLPTVESAVGHGRHAVVMAGHGAGAVAADFAAALGLPLLAEPSSNARFGPTAVSTYQYLLPALGADIDTVVLFGRPTLSRPQSALLAREDTASYAYLPSPVAWFEQGKRRERVVADLVELARIVGTAPVGWTQRWLDADHAAREAAEKVVLAREADTGHLTGPGLATTVWDATSGPLVLGSSRPIRDLDLMARPRGHVRAYANRGLAGIDGTIATASGVALGEGRRTLALMGDVTFMHDVGGLLTPSGEQVPQVDVVVAQDDGGTIFSTLEHGAVGEDPGYALAVDRFFRTPHGRSAAAIAEAYGWEVSTANTRAEVAAWIAAGTTATRQRLLEVPVESENPRGLHTHIADAVAQALRG